jgi:predicted metal-dependent hydrolase
MRPVQLRLPWTAVAPGPRAVEVGGRLFPVQITRHRRARRYILRVTGDGVVRVTVPRGASIAGALAFAAGETQWIAAEWRRRSAQASWANGTTVWYRGEAHVLVCTGATITCGPLTLFRRPAADDDVRARLQAHWRAEAADELPARCVALGRPHGLVPARIVVRNQRSRWGSCSSRGSIALNWRLIQMPSEVADYVMLHELVHLKHPNHSTRFWRRVAAVCPSWRASERWLRTHGRDLL